MPQKQKLSAEEKAKVIEDYINNRISLSEAARRGGIARDTISQWARNYEADIHYYNTRRVQRNLGTTPSP